MPTRFARARRLRRLHRSLLAIFVAPSALALAWLGAALALGALPAGGTRAVAAGGVEIFVVSNGYHASFVVPIAAQGIDWRAEFPANHFKADIGGFSHVMFGWGDRDFYMNTRTLADFRLGTGVRAMLSLGDAVAHVTYIMRPETGEQVRRLALAREQYHALAIFLRASFADGAEARPLLHPGMGYGPFDAFYVGTGRYSLIMTCNEWVGRGLRTAGLPTGWWTPLSGSLLWHLPRG